MALKDKFAGGKLRDTIKKELIDQQYNESIINECLTNI